MKVEDRQVRENMLEMKRIVMSKNVGLTFELLKDNVKYCDVAV